MRHDADVEHSATQQVAPESAPPSPSGKGASAPSLVIGFGNPLRQDDGFGWRVAEQLLANGEPSGAEVVACQQLTPELAEPLSRVRVAIFVDVRLGEPVGLLECEEIPLDERPPSASVHNLTPSALLALTKALYGAVPERVYLLTARSVHFAHADALSPALQMVVPEAVLRIRQLSKRSRM